MYIADMTDRLRSYDVATDGSDVSELLCGALLEPKADSLIGGESFRDIQCDRVEETRKAFLYDETAVITEFAARKMGFSDDGEPEISYNLTVTLLRPRRDNELWPESELKQNEDFDELEESSAGLIMDEESDEDEGLNNLFYVQEVWDYYLDNISFLPRKDLRYEYYNGSAKLLGLLSATTPLVGEEMLDEDMDTEIDLQIKESIFTKAFTEDDIELLVAVCDNDFLKIKMILTQAGCFDEGFLMADKED